MFSLSVHEFAHAVSAYAMGDKTAKMAGRMTLNPFKHIDLSGFILFIFLGVGWAKPVPVNPMNFKKFKKGNRIVSVSGVLANFFLGLIAAITCAILFVTVGVEVAAMEYVYTVLFYLMLVNSFLALFNLLPFAPLDGFNFIATFLKPDNKFLNKMLHNGFRILIVLIVISLFTDIFFGVDIFSWYLSVLYNYVYVPITFIGV